MFFTQEDYYKIEKWLQGKSIKDTQFIGADALVGNETVAIVLNGKNKNILVRQLVNSVPSLNNNDFINVKERLNISGESLANTILKLPKELYKEGQVITFLDSQGYWEMVLFIGSTQVQWNDEKYWKAIRAEGGGGGNFDDFKAQVTKVESTELANATVDLNNKTFNFTFDLPKGEKGDKGDRGDKGDKGEKGSSSVSGKTVLAFKHSLEQPETPIGGSWDIKTDKIIFPKGWGPTDNLLPPIYMSTGEFIATNPNNPKWSRPIKITGDDGINGKDGVNTEYVFQRTKNILSIPNKPIGGTKEEVALEGWKDHPLGISEEFLVEWISSRNKLENGSWSIWSEPAIWSKWGANGQDGDGVEYIYKVNNGEVLSNPTPDDINTNLYLEKGEFENIEYVPEGWTDNPTGVSTSMTHEWVCVRKYKDGKWGPFSSPSLWAIYGEKGDSGISLRIMYAKTSNSSEVPQGIQKNEINPGSIWGLAFPNYTPPEAVWCILAYVTYDNKLAVVTDSEGNLVTGWQGPWIVTGTKGDNGNPADYKVYVYKKSDSKPEKPVSTNPKEPGEGWLDYPNDIGLWWLCIGNVNGKTELVSEWSEVLIVNGRDGTALDGKFTEFRFKAYPTKPEINQVRTPNGWSLNPPVLGEGEHMWMSTAIINPDDSLFRNWSDPVLISGELGPKGDTGPAGERGPNGITGVPGVSFEVKYCLGTLNSFDGLNPPIGNSPENWLEDIPSVTEVKPYIWCIQGKRKYSSSEDSIGTIIWNLPFKLSGTNILGNRGQLVYPAGIYSELESYTTTDKVAPYVYSTSTRTFYVLNTIMTWKGTEQSTPMELSDAWIPFSLFEAIYTDILVAQNALVGSSVFNGDFVFSLLGKGNDYSQFNPSDPYNPSNSFIPNICFNYKTGEAWLGQNTFYASKDDMRIANWKATLNTLECEGHRGTGVMIPTKLTLDSIEGIKCEYSPTGFPSGLAKKSWAFNIDGSGEIAEGKIKWDSEGNITSFPLTSNNIQTVTVLPDNPDDNVLYIII